MRGARKRKSDEDRAFIIGERIFCSESDWLLAIAKGERWILLRGKRHGVYRLLVDKNERFVLQYRSPSRYRPEWRTIDRGDFAEIIVKD